MLGGAHPGAGLIGMNDRLLSEAVLQLGDEGVETTGGFGLDLAQPSCGNREAEQVFEQLGGALDGQVLAIHSLNSGDEDRLGRSGGYGR
jgi:hypothetical protein